MKTILKSSKELREKAKWVRREIFDFKTRSKIGHLATCLSTVDILVSLFYDSYSLFDPDNDEIVFSKGHGAPTMYPILADLKYFPMEELAKYGTKNGILPMHCNYKIPGCQFVGGSLGNGIGFAAGRGYDKDRDIYVILGDGELYEGSVWETLLFISHHNLNNIRLIVDRNQLCILGATEDMVKLNPLPEKFKAFGYEVEEIDGHNFRQIRHIFAHKPQNPKTPKPLKS